MVLGDYALPAVEGDRVRFTRTSRGFFPLVVGEGTFSLCWLGVAEVWDVQQDDGATVHLYPELGDTMERIG